MQSCWEHPKKSGTSISRVKTQAHPCERQENFSNGHQRGVQADNGVRGWATCPPLLPLSTEHIQLLLLYCGVADYATQSVSMVHEI